MVDNDYNRILQEDDTNLTIDEIKVKNGLKSKEDYYKYTSDTNIVLSKLINKYNDDKIPYLYNYLEVDLQEFERIVNEANNKCK